ncbi:MAG: hypothetical protein ABSE49_24835 [Polyangiaceae bacterium]
MLSLRIAAARLALVALAGACIAEASCSGKAGTCAVEDCGSVQTVDLGFVCEEDGVPPYATVVKTVVTGPCTTDCDPAAAGACALVVLSPTEAGACSVEVTSSTGEVFPLSYAWVATQVTNAGTACPGCFTLNLADGSPSPTPFARSCDGGAGGG